MDSRIILALLGLGFLAVATANPDYGYKGGYDYDYSKYHPKWPVGDIYGLGGYGGGYGGKGYDYGAPPVTYIPGYGKYVPYSMPLYGNSYNYGPAHSAHKQYDSYGYNKY